MSQKCHKKIVLKRAVLGLKIAEFNLVLDFIIDVECCGEKGELLTAYYLVNVKVLPSF